MEPDGLSESKGFFAGKISEGKGYHEHRSTNDDHKYGWHIPRPALLPAVVVAVAASTIVVPAVVLVSAAALHDFDRADSVFSVQRCGARVDPRALIVDTWQQFRSALLGSRRRRVALGPIRPACFQSHDLERRMQP